MIIKVPGKPGDLAKISHRYDEDFIGKIRDEFTYNYETKALWLTIEQRKYARAFPSIYIEPLGETESEVVIPDAKDYTGTIEWDYNGKTIKRRDLSTNTTTKIKIQYQLSVLVSKGILHA